MLAIPNCQVEIFYDSLCPVCRREVEFLQRRDQRGSLRLVDIAHPDFDPEQYELELSDFIGRMYVRDGQGVLRHGLDSFPIMWGAVGLGWVWGWTRVPGLRQLGMVCYALFAKVRPRFSKFKPCLPEDACRLPRREE